MPHPLLLAGQHYTRAQAAVLKAARAWARDKSEAHAKALEARIHQMEEFEKIYEHEKQKEWDKTVASAHHAI